MTNAGCSGTKRGMSRAFAAAFVMFGFAIAAVAQTPPSFEKHVAPILVKRCLECHGETDPSGKLNLTTRESILKGGESGPAVTPFETKKSLLYARVMSGEMPPSKRGHSQKLPENEAATLGMWIVFGCQWPEGRKLDLFESTTEVRAGRDWWSLQPVRRPKVPTLVPSPPSSGERARVRGPKGEKASELGSAESLGLRNESGSESKEKPPHPNPLPRKAGGEGTREALRGNLLVHPQPSTIDHQPVRSPIDAFIASKLQANQMEPAPQADRATLIKRLSFDLLGLPPSFEEVEAFVSDPAPDAYERLVDRLLASPHFGERWARHWLDLVRYADTSGYERDQEKTGAWKYRDWVVRAINEDMSYSRFITEQLAGDELPDRDEQSLIATGFLRLGTWNDEPNDAEEYKYDRLEDLVGATSTAFLGYTVKCARCHDHKFDPIQQADYYRMAAAFWPGPIEQRGRELLGGPSREELDAALGLPPSAISPLNKPMMPDILAWTDVRSAPPIHLLKKGEPKHPGAVVEPGEMSFVQPLVPSLPSSGERARVRGPNGEDSSQFNSTQSLPAAQRGRQQGEDKPPHPNPLPHKAGGEGTRQTPPPSASLRRTQLAHWIAHPDNPLTWRVVMNRLWTHHFGNGLVRSPDNFGFTGERPTHPEFLDWLAGDVFSVQFSVFSEDGPSHDTTTLSPSLPLTEHRTLKTENSSSLKRLHRQLVTSATYRQSSLHPQQDEYSSRDAGNHLWWHAERRRLDAESLRDRMLFVGDSLDSHMAGPGFKATIQAEALEGLSRKGAAWSPSPPHEQLRRSLYSYSARSLLPPLMTTFDFGDTTLPCGQRPVSTVAPQALALLNNAFAHERSTALATVVLSLRRQDVPSAERQDYTNDGTTTIRLAWKLALAREPSERELAAARSHLAEQRQRFAGTSLSTEYSVLGPQQSGSRPPLFDARLSPVLHLQADSGIKTDEDGRVLAWKNQAGDKHFASQNDAARRPLLVKDAGNGHAALRFDGQRRFLHLNGQVITSQSFAIFAVVSDRATTNAHREIFSNWNGAAGNSGSSLFLGTTGEDTVRLSDDFSGVGHVAKRAEPFLLSGLNGAGGAVVRQNDLVLASKGGPLAPRNLTTAYVIGQQGNIDGEYWHGDLFELLVYNRDLSERDRHAVQRHLCEKYRLPRANTSHDPDFLALASLCHVLLNTNEFAYVD